MGKRRKKSSKISIGSIFLVLLIILSSRFINFNKDDKSLETSNNSQYETRVDENKDKKDDNIPKEEITEDKSNKTNQTQVESKDKSIENTSFDYKRDVSPFSGRASIEINNNTPFFSKPNSTKVYKKYSDLDNLNRVGTCELVTGTEYLPKEKRGDISHVKPTGWKQKKYNFVDGQFLYNRCHLIGHQIAGDNDDWRNLMTGTRYMNVDGMLPYENEVANYIKSTKNHVKYRVSPIFIGDEKVARGVLMEAYSIEDNRLKFNVFCYNVQPRVSIDYQTGYSKLSK